MDEMKRDPSLEGIAIIGIAGRFPGARSVEQFWQNLCNGVESISFFSDEELLASGVDPTWLHDPNYVKAGFALDDIEWFDASFFGFTPREAKITDPQHRFFLESAWSALENAGYESSKAGLIGVYAGSASSSYCLNNLIPNPDSIQTVGSLSINIGNIQDFLATRVSYKLNLKGPSVNVSTACSTSLVAIHLACRGLLNYDCDLALAGGVSITVPQKQGYFYQEGGMASSDGHCRAFDAKAEGCPFGSGVGVVVLKRLEEALGDGDSIYAVIKGSAINNDGFEKVSFTASSVTGQAEVIADAQAIAGFAPETITYIETHGTGTALGDPIEIRALDNVFCAGRNQERWDGFTKQAQCAIGSVKTNISHLDRAAGVAGLIKTLLALKHQQIPPTLHFEHPNPEIDFTNTPFYVNTKLTDWETNGIPRRAGVSAFGLGGTNAHVVLEEAPPQAPSGNSRPWQLLVISAKTSTALETATANFVDYLQQNPDLNLADVAYTLQLGRRAFSHRRAVVCRDVNDAITAFQDAKRVLTYHQPRGGRPVAFLFPGLGTHYVNMAWHLYQGESTFRNQVDQCCNFLQPLLGLDLRDVLYPGKDRTNPDMQEEIDRNSPNSRLDFRKLLARAEGQADTATQTLNQTFLAQPILFIIEYALAQLWMSWGIYPQVMLGYSIGEYVAACLAGVMSLEDALTLVTKRAQMIQELPGGAMLAVPLSAAEVAPLLKENLFLAAIQAPSLCVISGSTDAVDELIQHLTEKGFAYCRLQTSHAFHSRMLEPIATPLIELTKTFNLQPPKIPYLSNVTGTWITPDEATAPAYWAKHMCQPVRFAENMAILQQEPERILLEVGPGGSLSQLAVQPDADSSPSPSVLASLRHPHQQQSDMAFLLNTLGNLWLAGVPIDWSGFYAYEQRHRVHLPTYPFERQRYWIESPKTNNLPPPSAPSKNNPAPLDLKHSSHKTGNAFEVSNELEPPESLSRGEPNQSINSEEINNQETGTETKLEKHSLEQLITQQLEIISQQLDLLNLHE
ncbi:type I polyketide synthase [Halomicronema hongdechloris C2206]|uniref:Type I polyketide synthase n=1 Tax=Halomicronema hongdechloris C2206 TaxID=1641165 RepID=A0A1Z3HL29_9CYAN|nr:type I polyketide synthase [Halomicronema hongdechloris]ASC71029.1 type I polyketide synthase [Halomicronema hongdechloris C2206]